MTEMRDHTPEEANRIIEARVAEYSSGAGGWLGGFEEIARSRQLLPVHIDLFTAYFVSPTGEVFSCDVIEETPSPRKVENRAERLGVLSLAQERAPELSAFLPERSPSSEVCRACNGSGKLSFDGQPVLGGKVICPECGSLGWTDAVGDGDG